MSGQFAVIIQNLTSELDQCKRRLSQVERENERLRQRLTAALTAAAARGGGSSTSNGMQPSQVSTGAGGGDACESDTTTPLAQSTTDAQAKQWELSPSGRIDSVPLSDADADAGLTVGPVNTDGASEAPSFSASRVGHGRTRSCDPNAFLSASAVGSVHSGCGGSPSVVVASLRRKVEALERREMSWKEQVSSLSRQLDVLRTEKDYQVHSLQCNLQDLVVQLRDAQQEVAQLRLAGNASTAAGREDGSLAALVRGAGEGGACTVLGSLRPNSAASASTLAVGSSTRGPDDDNDRFSRRLSVSGASGPVLEGAMKRRQSMVVLKQKTNAASGRDELFAEMPREDLEDVLVTHSSHVRTSSNNLVPISAVAAGVVSVTNSGGSFQGGGPSSSGLASSGIVGGTSALLSSSAGKASSGGTAVGISSGVAVNPNQLGEIVLDEPKDKRWYLQAIIRVALKKALQNDRGFLGDGAGSSRGPVTLPTLQGKSVSVISVMVKENLELYFYLKDNRVVLSESAVSGLPPFHKQNADPVLLQHYSNSSTGVNSSDVASSQGSTGSSGGGGSAFSWLQARSDQMRIIFSAITLFSYIRAYLRFDAEGFLRAVDEAVWRESVSPGKSDASMYFFGNYVIKSVKESEYRFLKDAYLAMFAKYTEANPNTLLSKFFLLFSVYWLRKGTRRHFVVMNNVFWTKYYINKIYDIKGSSAGRDADHQEGARTAFGALLLKDNDLPLQLIICGPMKRATLLAQLRSDTSFLASLSVVDYSCIIGIRTRVFTRENRYREQMALASKKSSTADSDDVFSFTSADGGILSLPIYAENDSSTVREDTYYIGLIDVLQTYTPQKRFEHFAKGLLMDKHTISVVPPSEFSERLCKVLERITV